MKGQVVLWKNSISYWEKFLHEVGHTLEQIAQSVGSSSLEVLRTQLDSPEQPGLTVK